MRVEGEEVEVKGKREERENGRRQNQSTIDALVDKCFPVIRLQSTIFLFFIMNFFFLSSLLAWNFFRPGP
jgi:hypothetical protein